MNTAVQLLGWGMLIMGCVLLLIFSTNNDNTGLDATYTDEGNISINISRCYTSLPLTEHSICVCKHIQVRYYDEVNHIYLHYRNQSDGVFIDSCYNITIPIDVSFFQTTRSGRDEDQCIDWVNNSCKLTRITTWHIHECDWAGDPAQWIV